MTLLRDAEKALSNKLLPLWIYAAGLLAVLTTPIRLTDHTHEIQIIGYSWFHGGSIPIVQAYSNFSPVNLYIGGLYERYISNTFTLRLVDLALFSIIAGVLYSLISTLHIKRLTYQNALLALALLIVAIPGVWQVGINPAKLGFLFLVVMYYSYLRWQNSKKSYWLFGETQKNSRWLVLSGLALSGLVFSSLLLSLFALPLIIDFLILCAKDWKYGLRQSIILFAPTFIQGWLWYSYFASRNLLTEAMRAAGLDVRLALQGLASSPRYTAIIIFPLAIVIVLMLLAVRGDNFYKDRKGWLMGAGMLLAIILSHNALLLTLPFIYFLAILVYLNKFNPAVCALWCTVGLVLALPYRYLDASSAKIADAQAQIAKNYVEQRLIDSDYVLYYGRGAGFFHDSNLSGSSRYYNSAIFPYDTDTLGLVDKFRGDNEGNTPMFAVYATDDTSRVGDVPRIEMYLKRHYEKVADLDGYEILKRKQ